MFLHPGAKRAKKIDVNTALYDSVASTHGEQSATTILTAAQVFQRLRSPVHEPPTTSRTHADLQAYYRALSYLLDDLKFPSQIPVPLLWVNAFDGSSDASIPQLSFDQLSVLFNLAVNEASLAQLAYRRHRTEPDALRISAKHYQLAAGYFAFAREFPPPAGIRCLTPDLFPAALTALENVMLGNAQQSIYLHCRSTNVSNALLSRIAAGISDFYSIAIESASDPDLRSTSIHSLVALPCRALQKHFHTVSIADAATAASDSNNLSDMLSLLPMAIKAANSVPPIAAEAASVSAALTSVSDLCEQIRRASSELSASLSAQLRDAEEDNRRIYFASPSENPKLPLLHRFVKTDDISETLANLPVNPELSPFASLPPPPTEDSMELASRYEEMAASLVASEVASIHTAASSASHALSMASSAISMARERLTLRPSTLGRQSNSLTVEETTAVNALRDVIARGGGRAVRDLQAQVVSAAGIATSDIDNILKTLNKEAAQDRSLQMIFPGQRPNSPSLTTGYHNRIEKMKRNLEQAANADAIIAADIDKHYGGMDAILRLDVNDIVNRRLNGNKTDTQQGRVHDELDVERASARFAALKASLDEVMARKSEVVLELETKKQMDNAMVATARMNQGDDEIEQILDMLNQKYGEAKRDARSICQQLLNVTKDLTDLSDGLRTENIGEANGKNESGDGGNGMMEIYKHQPAALKFQELMQHLAHGMEFYSKEQDNITALKHDVEGFVKGRDIEYKDMTDKRPRYNQPPSQPPMYQSGPGHNGPGMYPGGSDGYPQSFGGWGNAGGRDNNFGGSSKWGRR